MDEHTSVTHGNVVCGCGRGGGFRVGLQRELLGPFCTDGQCSAPSRPGFVYLASVDHEVPPLDTPTQLTLLFVEHFLVSSEPYPDDVDGQLLTWNVNGPGTVRVVVHTEFATPLGTETVNKTNRTK